MIALKAEDVRDFTSKLFLGEAFDGFLVKEAKIVTYNQFSIDGHIRKGYFGPEELEEKGIEEFSSWAMLRPFCFSLIKGKKLPESFQIVLQLPARNTEQFAASSGCGMDGKQIQGLYLNIRYEDGAQHILLCGEDVSDAIRTPEIAKYASKVSAVPEVRQFLLETQRDMAKNGNILMDGRDIGTVILPDAPVKIFLTASAEARAQRRYLELHEKGQSITFDEVLHDIQ